MNLKMIITTALAMLMLSPQGLADGRSPYSGEQMREIKALSDAEVAGLLSGRGLGYAKAAELNGYPGPAHVLELARELDLSTAQRDKTRAIFDRMQDAARKLGERMVAAERQLDQAFANKTIAERSVSELTARIGQIEAQLREVHLQAHLDQTQLMTETQIARYVRLRGYSDQGQGDHHHHNGE